MDSAYNDILEEASPAVHELVEKTRGLIHDVYPPVVEVPWVKQKIIGFGVGRKKNSEHFCYISVHKEYINLGFNYGSELPDPGAVLRGTSKLYRHVRIARPAHIDSQVVRKLLIAASRHRMPDRD